MSQKQRAYIARFAELVRELDAYITSVNSPHLLGDLPISRNERVKIIANLETQLNHMKECMAECPEIFE